jgi:hypothetical protein
MVIAGSALKAIIGQRLVPGLLDRYLARMGYDAQQTDQPVAPDRPDNLYTTIPGDHGAHGPFTAPARSQSLQLWLRLHPRHVASGLGALASLGALAALGARWRSS